MRVSGTIAASALSLLSLVALRSAEAQPLAAGSERLFDPTASDAAAASQLDPGARARLLEQLGLTEEPDDIRGTSAEAGTGCTGGIQYDDGTFEDGVRTTSTLAHNFVMEFQLPGGSNRIDAVCVCFSRASTDPSVTFRLNFYAPDGPGGGPGTLLGFATPNVASPPLFGFQFARVDIPGGLNVSGDRVYIGPAWSELLDDDFFLCLDSTGPGGRKAYLGNDLVDAPTVPVTGADYRALGIRAEAVATSDCLPSSTALCLNQGRFKVEATFNTGTQQGQAQVVKLTDETGYLWFFNSNNVEAVVKILNGCGIPGSPRYWVFAGGLTNVETVITVTDTETHAVKTYVNPQGTAFQPIQDTGAFATCP